MGDGLTGLNALTDVVPAQSPKHPLYLKNDTRAQQYWQPNVRLTDEPFAEDGEDLQFEIWDNPADSHEN